MKEYLNVVCLHEPAGGFVVAKNALQGSRRHLPDGVGLLLIFALVVLSVMSCTKALPPPPSNAFRFLHAADGRLTAAIDPEGETAAYSWDAAGNLLSISRGSSSKLSIVQLSPAKGEIGQTIEIEGTGFSTTPGVNTVKFNGTAATVQTATPWLR